MEQGQVLEVERAHVSGVGALTLAAMRIVVSTAVGAASTAISVAVGVVFVASVAVSVVVGFAI